MESALSILQWCSLMTALVAMEVPATRCPSEEAAAEKTGSGVRLEVSASIDDGLTPTARQPTGKPWIDDYAAYVNSKPGRSTVVGECGQIALSQQEAESKALLDAANKVYDRLRPRLNPRLRGRDQRDWILVQLASDLAERRYVIDEHSSSSRRVYGQIWSHWVLVDTSGNRLATLAGRYNSIEQARRSNARQTFASVAALSVLILLVYGVTNAWTKGYVRWRLRTAAVFVLVAGAWVLIRLGNVAP
jgi:hypothetical protein